MQRVLYAAYYPGAIGILCAQEAILDKEDSVKTRVLAGAAAIVLAPFIVLSFCMMPLIAATQKA